jgi:hypothetical protein
LARGGGAVAVTASSLFVILPLSAPLLLQAANMTAIASSNAINTIPRNNLYIGPPIEMILSVLVSASPGGQTTCLHA